MPDINWHHFAVYEMCSVGIERILKGIERRFVKIVILDQWRNQSCLHGSELMSYKASIESIHQIWPDTDSPVELHKD